jgi:protein-S-isoprenylcysteine O-methyltransferase Ste14
MPAEFGTTSCRLSSFGLGPLPAPFRVNLHTACTPCPDVFRLGELSRLFVTVLFGVAAVAVAVSAIEAVDAAISTGTTSAWAAAVYDLLRFCVILTFTVLVSTRRESIRPSREPIAFAACAAALVTFAVLTRPNASGATGRIIGGDAVAAIFEAWLLVSVLALGRCFGILPEARGLVARGPYRVVRHPVYLGELGVVVGFVIAAPSFRNLAVAPVAVVSQLVRIRLEERELAANFPAYREYAAKTPMLVPVPRRRRRSSPLLSGEPLAAPAVTPSNTRGGTD